MDPRGIVGCKNQSWATKLVEVIFRTIFDHRYYCERVKGGQGNMLWIFIKMENIDADRFLFL